MAITHVPGKESVHIMLYALSTCVWCAKTRKLLDDLGVAYDYEYIDLLQGEEKKNALLNVQKWNASCSFPTIVIDNKKCITGFKEDDIRQALKK